MGGSVQNRETDPMLVDSARSKRTSEGNPRFLFILTAFAALSGFLFGYDTGVVSGAMLLLKKQYSFSDVQIEVIVSATIATAILGAVTGGPLNSKFGRRFVILFAAVTFTIGALILGLAEGYTMLVVGRAILGIGIGMSSMTSPLYLAECAPSELRGQLTVVNTLFITGGQFVAGIVDGTLSNTHEGWRYMLGLAALPAVLQILGFIFLLPESPRWLISVQKITKAQEILQQIRGSDSVEEEIEEIKKSFSAKTDFGWRDFLAERSLRNALLVGAMLQAIQQLTGINTVMYYSATILKEAGIDSDEEAIWIAAGIAGLNFVFTIVGLVSIDRMGRRKLLLSSLFLVCVSLAVLAVAFRLGDSDSPMVDLALSTADCQYHTCVECIESSHCGFCSIPSHGTIGASYGGICVGGQNQTSIPKLCTEKGWRYDYCPNAHAWLAILALVLFIVAFAPGMGPCPWTVNSEIYPPQCREFGNSVATAVNWICNLVMSMTFLSFAHAISSFGAFLCYAGIGVLGWIFFYFKLPETKGKSLEEIQKLF